MLTYKNNILIYYKSLSNFNSKMQKRSGDIIDDAVFKLFSKTFT